MRKHILLSAMTAGLVLLGSTAADAQSRVFKPRSSNPNAPDQSQLSIDVSQYSPEAQMAKMARNVDLLVQQNQQMAQDLNAAMQKIDAMEGRLRSISTVLTTGTGESIGSMVNKIKGAVGVPY